MSRTTWAKASRVALLLALAWLATTGRTLAHGGGTPQLVRAPAGSYLLYAWTKPEPVRVGDAHITVGVFQDAPQGRAEEPVLDARVTVALSLVGSDSVIEQVASTAESANKLYYEADLALPEAGSWQVALLVEGPAGAARVDFDLQVLPPRRVNWGLVGGGAVVLVAVAWLAWSGRKRKAN